MPALIITSVYCETERWKKGLVVLTYISLLMKVNIFDIFIGYMYFFYELPTHVF